MVTATKTNKLTKILGLISKGFTAKQIAKKANCTVPYVYAIKRKYGAYAVDESGVVVAPVKTEGARVFTINHPPLVEDLVNHPQHYKEGGIETIDFIEAKKLDYHLGNVVKYVSRADHKGNKLQDLQKAQWYLNRAIEKITSPKA